METDLDPDFPETPLVLLPSAKSAQGGDDKHVEGDEGRGGIAGQGKEDLVPLSLTRRRRGGGAGGRPRDGGERGGFAGRHGDATKVDGRVEDVLEEGLMFRKEERGL